MAKNHSNGGILYSRLSDYYDTLFRWITLPRQKVLLRSLDIAPGARVMDLGVGTGLSLHLYPRHCHVTAVDISQKMLVHARRRVERKKLTHVEILQMDAHRIDEAFQNGTFDVIVAAFVLTVLKDPVKVLRHMKRIGKPDCSMFIVSHARSRNPLLERCEKALDPVCKRLGWNYAVDLEEVIEEAGLKVVAKRPCFPYDPYVIVQAKNGVS